MTGTMAEAALLFDLDGTMMMTDPIHMGVFADLLAPRGLSVDQDFYMKHIHGRLNVDFFAEFLPDEPDPQGLSDLKEYEFRRRLPRPYPAMPGVMAVLQEAQNNGCALGVVTNAKRENAEAMLADWLGESRFVTGDMVPVRTKEEAPRPRGMARGPKYPRQE